MTATEAADKTAPGPLELVQRFVNTLDLDREEESLNSPEELAGWLADAGLVAAGTPAKAADLERAVAVREGLRAVLYTHNGGAPDAEALARLDRVAAGASLRTTFGAEGPALTPAGDGVDAALASLLAIVATAATEGTWGRLRACADPSCRWAFYDHSRNRSGRWCSMAVCGNQQKARAYRRRARETP